MKSTKYSRFCTKIFGNIFSKYNKDEYIEKNIILAQADIAQGYNIYYSMALMNTIIALIGTLILVLLVHVFIPSAYTLLSIVIVPSIVMVCIGITYLFLPKYYIKKRARNNAAEGVGRKRDKTDINGLRPGIVQQDDP